ncbi:MAG: hypothetical protein AB7P00_10885, partial [Sandaracinaceae bacterium]
VRSRIYALCLFLALAAAGECVRGDAAAQVLDDPSCDSADCPAIGRSFDDDPNVASPPVIVGPIYECTSHVEVRNTTAGATVKIIVGGVLLTTVTAGSSGVYVDVSPWLGRPFLDTDAIVVQQTVGGVTTTVGPEDVRKWEADFPGGFPAPLMTRATLRDCGRAIGTDGGLLRGATVTYYQLRPDATLDILATGVARYAAERVESLPTVQGSMVWAFQELCGFSSASAPAQVYESIALPPPRILTAFYDESGPQTIIESTEHAFGAAFEVVVDGVGTYGNISMWEPHERTTALTYPTHIKEFQVSQGYCTPGDPGPVFEEIWSCNELPSAQIQPPQVGDETVVLDVYVPSARIRVYAGPTGTAPTTWAEIGDTDDVAWGRGAQVQLIRPLALGESVAVVQSVGTCTSLWAHVIEVQCLGVERQRALETWGRFGVASVPYTLYGGDPVPLSPGTFTSSIAGQLYYPTDYFDGELAHTGTFPVVAIMHGELPNMLPPGQTWADECVAPAMQPGYLEDGYTFVEPHHHVRYSHLAEALARDGFVVISIDAWDITCRDNWTTYLYVEEGGDLFLQHLDFLDDLDHGVASPNLLGGAFAGRLDLLRTTLIGHSRGAWRVSAAHAQRTNPNVDFAATILLAPPDQSLEYFGDSRQIVTGPPMLLFRGSRDREDPPSFGVYDRALTDLRSMAYMHGGTHNGYLDPASVYYEATPAGGAGINGPLMPVGTQQAILRELVRRWTGWHAQGNVAGAPVFDGRAVVRGLPDSTDLAMTFADANDLVLDDFANEDPSTPLFVGDVTWSGFDDVIEDELQTVFLAEKSKNEGPGLVLYASAPGGTVTWLPATPFDLSACDYLTFRIGTTSENESAPGPALNVALSGGLAQSVSTLSVIRLPPALNHEIPSNPFESRFNSVMTNTMSIPLSCLAHVNPELDLSSVDAVWLRNVYSQDIILDHLTCGVRHAR